MVLLNDMGHITHMNILVLGDKHTGKSSLISTFVNPKKAITCSKDTYSPTIEDSVLIQFIANLYQNDIISSSASISGNQASSIYSQPGANFSLPNQAESMQDVLSQTTESMDLESILSEISTNTMDGSSYDYSVDTLNEVSLDDLSVTQSLYMERSEKDKSENYHTINLTITEVGGTEEFASLMPSAIEKADAFMFVYDVGNENSFHHIWNYFKKVVETKMEKPKDIPMILVGSMVDTIVKRITNSRNREVTSEQGRLLANLTNIPFFESSAKAPKVVTSCFKKLIYEAKRIYLDFYENTYMKHLRQQQEFNSFSRQNSYPLSDEVVSSYSSIKRLSAYKSLKTPTLNGCSDIPNLNNSIDKTSLTPQQHHLISSQPIPLSSSKKHDSNSTESSVSSTSTIKNNTMNTLDDNQHSQKSIMNNNNNSGNTLNNECNFETDLIRTSSFSDHSINKENSFSSSNGSCSTPTMNKMTSLPHSKRNKEDDKTKVLLSSPRFNNLKSVPPLKLPGVAKRNNSINSSNSGSISSGSGNNLLHTAIKNVAHQTIHSSLDRNNSGSTNSSFSSPSTRNLGYNDQIMYLPQSVSNTLNKSNMNSFTPHNEKRLSKGSLMDTTAASLISAISAMTLNDPNTMSSQTKTETLALLKNFIASQENEMAMATANENDTSNIQNNNMGRPDALSNALNNSIISLVSQSYSENCANLNKQNNRVNKKHYSDNSSILSNQLRHISSLSDLEFLKDKDLSQEQLLKDIYSSDTSPFKELKKLQSQLDEEAHHMNANNNTTVFNSQSIPLSPALSDATNSTHTSSSSCSSNTATITRNKNSILYNNMLNMKQQHYLQQNNQNVKPSYHHNLTNIMENSNVGVTQNDYYNQQAINLQNNNINNFVNNNNVNLLLQKQQQEQQYLKGSMNSPTIPLNNNNMYNMMNNNNSNNNITPNFDAVNGTSFNRMNQAPMNTNMANDDLIQLLNLYNVHIKKLQLQLLQQQKQIELTNSPLLGQQDNLNLYGNTTVPPSGPINNSMAPNLYNAVEPSLYNTNIPNKNLKGNSFGHSTFGLNNNLGMTNGYGSSNSSLGSTANTNSSMAMNNSLFNNSNNGNNGNTTTNNNNFISSPNPNGYLSQSGGVNVNMNVRSNMNSLQHPYYNGSPLTINGRPSTPNGKPNGLPLSSLANNVSSPSRNLGNIGISSSTNTNSTNTHTFDVNNLYQKRHSFTLNPTSLDTNDNNNEQSINNAKNLFLEVIKDFNENDIQDIVHGNGGNTATAVDYY